MLMGSPKYVVYANFFKKNKVLNYLHVYVYLIQVGVDKWMDITDMGYVIASMYCWIKWPWNN